MAGSVILWFEDKSEEQLLADLLLKQRFHIISCNSRRQLDELLPEAGLLIIDLNLKEADAILVCHELKQQSNIRAPFIIIVGDKTEDYTHVTALDLGADDYIAKPLKPQLILKRIEALNRRKNGGTQLEKQNGSGLYIDAERHLVIINSDEFELPKKEFDLLNLFYSVPNKIFTRQEIAVILWKEESVARQRTIDVHIRNIRKTLGRDLIKTVKGFGYGLNKLVID